MNLSVVSGFRTRDGSVDANLVHAMAADEYRLRDRRLSGWAIDVGAYIGTVAVQLARLNPGLQVLAIEAVPENADLIEANVNHFGLASRVTVIRAWAGAPNDLTGTCHYGYRGGGVEDDGYVAAHRFVGGTWRDSRNPEFAVEMPAVSLPTLLAQFYIDEVALLKIDCEGCEWRFLDTPAIVRIETIVGEYHGGITGIPDAKARLAELLAATHDIEWRTPQEPIVGLFEAVRR